MANKPISMSKVRQIIKLYSQEIGKKKIALRLGVSKNTVKHYVKVFRGLKTTWEELSKLGDLELNKRFHPPKEIVAGNKLKELLEFFPLMQKQLRKRGMTLARQFTEYKRDNPEGYELTQFYHYYRQKYRKIQGQTLFRQLLYLKKK